jgi:hypothetical protein
MGKESVSNIHISDKTKGDLRAYNPVRSGVLNHSTVKNKKDADAAKHKVSNSKRYVSFELNSYNWSEDYDPSVIQSDAMLPIQKMILTEFQPDFSYQWGETYEMAAGAAASAASMVPMFGDKIQQAAVVALKQTGKSILGNLQNQYISKPDMVVVMPMDFVRGLFAGTYQNAYEVPFFNETYLKADQTGNWSAGGAVQALGETIAGIMKEAMNVDFPTTPTWQISDVADREAISVEFFLINNSTTALIDNFRFLNSIISGAFWLQMDYVQKSPNVYDVEVPGRFHSYYAALGVEVTHVGKLRTNPDVGKSMNSLKSLNRDTLYPDAYKMTLNVVDLCPNNFNNYIDYLRDGRASQVQIGGTVKKMDTNDAPVKFAEDTIKTAKDGSKDLAVKAAGSKTAPQKKVVKKVVGNNNAQGTS